MSDLNSNIELKTQSDEINELISALSKAQAEYERVVPNRENPFFKSKYADIDAIITAVRPALHKNGLAFWQSTTIINNETILCSKVGHASGQWIGSYTKINPPKSDVQSYGSTVSYQCRYAAAPLLGVTISGDPSEDDGNKATQITTQPKKDYSESPLATWHIESLNKILIGRPDIRKLVCDKMRVSKIEEIKQKHVRAVITYINELLEKDE